MSKQESEIERMIRDIISADCQIGVMARSCVNGEECWRVSAHKEVSHNRFRYFNERAPTLTEAVRKVRTKAMHGENTLPKGANLI